MKAVKRVNVDSIDLRFKRLRPGAHSPLPRPAGHLFRLRAAADTIVPARDRRLVPTALSIELPPGSYAQLLALPEIVMEHFVDVGAGIIDSDYRGELQVLMINHGEGDYAIAAGQDVADMAVCLCPRVELSEVAELTESERAAKGFGSSGLA